MIRLSYAIIPRAFVPVVAFPKQLLLSAVLKQTGILLICSYTDKAFVMDGFKFCPPGAAANHFPMVEWNVKKKEVNCYPADRVGDW